jgi:hypothetical protein
VDALTFITKLLEHGLWPAAAFASVVYIIRNMERISGTVSKVKLKDVEVDFREKIAEVKQSASDQALTVFYPQTQAVVGQIDLAESRPQAFLVELTTEIERILIDWEKSRGKTGSRAPLEILDELQKLGLIGPDIRDPANRLFGMRNQYIHANSISITSGEALELLGIARSVRDRLKQKLDI